MTTRAISQILTPETRLGRLVTDWVKTQKLIKFGDFTLSSGKKSNVYLDLRSLIQFPVLQRETINQLFSEIVNQYQFDLQNSQWTAVCGPAYAGMPLATLLAERLNLPMTYLRKEAKSHGTNKSIEGMSPQGSNILLVDDVLTTGGSLIKTAQEYYRQNQVTVSHIAVLVDRRPMSERGQPLVFNLDDDKQICSVPVIALTGLEEILGFLGANYLLPMSIQNPYRTEYQTNNTSSSQTFRNKLYDIVNKKKSNLVFSVDVTQPKKLLELADQTGPYICMLKTHLDALETSIDTKFISELRVLADKHNFLIMEDRKFSDIGKTVQLQLTGHLGINTWADAVTCLTTFGEGQLQAIRQLKQNVPVPSVILVVQASTSNNLMTSAYTQTSLEIADKYPDVVCGLVCQQRLLDSDKYIHMTPGVSLSSKKDDLGQRYRTVNDAIQSGTDLIIVGRGISQSDSPEKAAYTYRKEGWDSYLGNLSN